MAELTVVGKSVIRNDILEKVTGKARYTNDFTEPGMLTLKLVKSPYPHARIKSIDVSKALALPGVVAVVTGKDAPDSLVGRMILDQPPIAKDEVRFAGEPVAVVAAETAPIAEQAVELIKVDYEELPAVFDAEEAMQPDCPVILHPNLGKYTFIRIGGQIAKPDPKRPNMFHSWHVKKGDLEKGFAEADLVIENRFFVPRIAHMPMETARAQAWSDPDGTLNIRGKKQGVYTWRTGILHYVGMSGARVRNLEPYTGGGFGGPTGIPDCIAGLMALKTGRPVKLIFTRDEQFTSAFGRVAVTTYMKDGVKKDGTLLAREMRVIMDAGPYSGLTSNVIRNASFGALATYRIPNLLWDSYGVYTNNPVAGPFRGFGTAETTWAIEQEMDIIAERLGIDPVELRQKNILKEGELNGVGEVTESIGVAKCLEKVSQAIAWGTPPEEKNDGWKRGKGVAIGNKYTLAALTDCVFVKIHQEGCLEIRHSATEMGQGVNTVLAQIAAESFGVPYEDVRIVFGDTAVVPYTMTTGSSSSTWHQGHATLRACEDAKRQIFALAAPILRAHPDALETRNWRIYDRRTPWKSISIKDVFGIPGWWVPVIGEIIGRGEYTSPYTYEDENGQSPRPVAYYSHGAHGVQVAVNPETGEIKVEKIAAAFDMGQPINPKMCEGQMAGGMVQGLGAALYEEIMLDRGRVTNPSLADYRIPESTDLPTNSECPLFIVPAPHKDGPYGAKGFSEGVMVPVAAAIANAVYNAVGVRVPDCPIVPEKLWKAMRAAK